MKTLVLGTDTATTKRTSTPRRYRNQPAGIFYRTETKENQTVSFVPTGVAKDYNGYRMAYTLGKGFTYFEINREGEIIEAMPTLNKLLKFIADLKSSKDMEVIEFMKENEGKFRHLCND